MKLGEGVEWALHCATVLAVLPPDAVLPGKALAELHGVSESYLLKRLTQAGLLVAVPGPRGGYRLAQSPDAISFLDIVQAVEGDEPAFRCNEIRQRDDPVALGRLLEAAQRAGATHLIYVGIAGIEKAADKHPYYAAKLSCERALAGSDMPHTILRSTQFHHFISFLLERLDVRVALFVPSCAQLRRLEPVAVEYVASR